MVKFSEQLDFSSLFRDFIYHPEKVSVFFKKGEIDEKIREISFPEKKRQQIIAILERQNRHWGAPSPVLDNIKKFTNPNAVAVFAGQQACLFGGPYMVMLKAMAVVRYARRLEKELKIPIVPIFWIVADDHDMREISFVDVFDTASKPARFNIDVDHEKKYPPVGTLTYDESILREVKKLGSLFPDNDFKRDALDPIEKFYISGNSIIDSFASYMLELTGHQGLVFFNPYDVEFKRAISPFLLDIIDRETSLKKELDASERQLQQSGYHLQVEKADTAVHLFLHRPERIALHHEAGRYKTGQKTLTRQELIDWVTSRPQDVSYDVITKPLVQSYFFPTGAVVLGPAEIAYYAQLMPLFKLFKLIPPKVISRPSLTLIEARFEKMLEQYELTFQQVALQTEQMVEKLAKSRLPERLGQSLNDYIDQNIGNLRDLAEDFINYDPNMKGPFDRAEKKLVFHLDELRSKIYSVHKGKSKTELERLERLHQNLYPNNGLAERSIALVYFISRYGKNVIDFIFDNLDIDAKEHQLLMLSEYHG